MNRLVFSGLAALVVAIQPVISIAQDSTSSLLIEEVVVTAQKRTQSAQDVPIAISAFSADSIEKMGLGEMSELANFAPNVSWFFGTSRDTPALSIRGASAFATCCANSKSPVGFYVDEVFQPSNVNIDVALFDVGRVEVLRGPQGTLFGRNAVAGAYSVTPNRPTEELSGYVKAELGDYDYYNVEGAIGGPVSDSLRVRIAGQVKERSEGLFFSRTLNKDYGSTIDSGALRFQAEYAPNDRFDALLNIGYSYDKGTPAGQGHISQTGADASCSWDSPVHPDQSLCGSGIDGYTDDDGDPWTTDEGAIGGRDSKGTFGALKFNYDFGSVTLSSVTGFTDYERKLIDQSADARAEIFLQADTGGDVKVFSQEIRLASNGEGSFNWIGGLYYATDEIGGAPQYWFDLRDVFGAYLGSTFDQKTTNIAAFGSLNFDLNDSLKLGVGLRYTDEDIDFNYESLVAFTDPSHTGFEDGVFGVPPGVAIISGGTVPGPTNPTSNTGNDSVSFKVSLDYTLSDTTLGYTSIAQGHKSGGFWADYTDDVSVLQPFGPETGTTYEVGFKSNPRDNLQVNGAVFLSKYDDLQVTVQGLTPAGLPANFVQNAGASETSGAELELLWLPTEGLSLNFGVGYLSSELTERTSTDPGIDEAIGQALGSAPEWTASGNARYEFPIGGRGMLLALQGDINYQGNGSSALTPRWRSREARTLVNASVTLVGPDEVWDLRAWAKNLTDEEYRVAHTEYLGAWGSFWMGDPRMVGLSGTYRFGE